MRYIDIVRTVVRNAQEKDIPALTWDEQIHHINAIRQKVDDIEIVVRCRDFRWFDKGENEVDSWSICTRTMGIKDIVIDTDYCSFADRRQESEVE